MWLFSINNASAYSSRYLVLIVHCIVKVSIGFVKKCFIVQWMSILFVSLLILMFSATIFARDTIQQSCPVIAKDKTGAVKSVPAGCFDYYVHAQFWAAESCHTYSGANATSICR